MDRNQQQPLFIAGSILAILIILTG